MPAFRAVRLRSILLAMGAVLLICSVYLYWTPTTATAHVVPSTAFEVPLAERQNALWKAFKPILQRHPPNCPTPESQGSAGPVHFDPSTSEPRPDLTFFDDNDRAAMAEAHENFLREVKESRKLLPVHTPGSRGLVTTAGGSYLPVFLASLRMLRRKGSTLPVEVYMKDDSEYQKHICKQVLPSLNARCMILSEIVGENTIEHFQLKIFAVLFSSFEQVIWMDADCFPLHKPEILLDAEPFTSSGLVTWPDFWSSTASPAFFEISKQPVPPMTDRQSSETGVFLVSKKTHKLTLFLAAYYNFYGPGYYFRLLTQGGPGEGDRETFLQAASAVGEPFYAVSERVQAIGHPKDGGDLAGSAMAQSDPIEDYALTSQGQWRVKDESVAKAPRIFFIHAHYPKFNPGDNLFGNKWETTPTLKPDGSDGRAWTASKSSIKRFGYDIEKEYWEEIQWVSCNLEDKFGWRGGVCDRVKEYWQNVFATPHDDDPKFTDDI